jgi:hypothetical protein
MLLISGFMRQVPPIFQRPLRFMNASCNRNDFDIVLSCGDDIVLDHLGVAGDDYFGRIPEQWTAQKMVRDHTPKELIWIGSKVHANTILAVRSKLDHMVLANIDADAIPHRRIKFIPMPLDRALRSFSGYFLRGWGHRGPPAHAEHF